MLVCPALIKENIFMDTVFLFLNHQTFNNFQIAAIVLKVRMTVVWSSLETSHVWVRKGLVFGTRRPGSLDLFEPWAWRRWSSGYWISLFLNFFISPEGNDKFYTVLTVT